MYYGKISFSLWGVKGIVLVLAALGIANMWMGVFADVGVTLLAVLNSDADITYEKEIRKQYERCNQKNRLHLFPLSKAAGCKRLKEKCYSLEDDVTICNILCEIMEKIARGN